MINYFIFIVLIAVIIMLFAILLILKAMAVKTVVPKTATRNLIDEQHRSKQRNLELILELFKL